MTTLRVLLPIPPSLNHLYRNVPGRGRVVTEDYRMWRELAGWAGAPWPRLADDPRNRLGWAVVIEARGLGHHRDLDNICKPVLDLIVTHTGLRDNYCNSVELTRGPLLSTETVPYLAVRVGIDDTAADSEAA